MLTWDVHFNLTIDFGRLDLHKLLARAQALADVIHEIPLPPRVQERLHRLNILRAVRGTTGIEGVELSTTEVEAIIEAPTGQSTLAQSRQIEEQEARNAYDVMCHIAGALDEDPDQPLTEQLIGELHRRMFAGILQPGNVPGAYRVKGTRVGEYLPPAPERVPELMRHWIEWMAEPAQRRLDPVTRAVLAHFYLVSIHPYMDGNGRTGRAVESFVLYQRTAEGGGINTRGFYSLANFYYRQRTEYFRLLNLVRQTDDLTPLLLFAAGGLVEELDSLCREILQHIRVIAFRDYTRGHLSRMANLRASNRSRLLRLVLSLLDLQVHTGKVGVAIAQLREGEGLLAALYEDRSMGTLNRDLKFLRDEKLVVVESGFVRVNLELMNEFTPAGPAPQCPPSA